ncbi:MAG TPA: energy transducer TonB [Rhodanobacter sp.]|nr:energy transducer TonB [Rhodanobacter sp.]
MKRWLLGLLCLVLSGVALASGPQGESIRASMLVTGTIQAAPDGSVATYAIDHPESLPPAVRSLLSNAIPTWKFDPLADGKAAAPKVPIAVRVVATTMDGDKVRLEIEGVHFGPPDHDPGIAVVKQEKPVYPPAAEHALVHGTVYLAMRVDPAGKVADVAVQQVDMGAVGRDAELNHWRELLGRVSREAASQWVFTPASDAATPYRIVRMSVTFALRSIATGGSTKPAYGHWNVYEPGPVQPVPWLDDKQPAGGVDALPDGDIDLVGHGLRMRAQKPRI